MILPAPFLAPTSPLLARHTVLLGSGFMRSSFNFLLCPFGSMGRLRRHPCLRSACQVPGSSCSVTNSNTCFCNEQFLFSFWLSLLVLWILSLTLLIYSYHIKAAKRKCGDLIWISGSWSDMMKERGSESKGIQLGWSSKGYLHKQHISGDEKLTSNKLYVYLSHWLALDEARYLRTRKMK